MNRIEIQLNLVPVQRKGTVNMADAQPAAEITAAPEPAPENEDPVIEQLMTQIRALSLTTKQKKELMKCVRLEFGAANTGLTKDGKPDRRTSAGRELERKHQEDVDVKERARNRIVITLKDEPSVWKMQNAENNIRLSKIQYGTFTMSGTGEVFKNDQPVGKHEQLAMELQQGGIQLGSICLDVSKIDWSSTAVSEARAASVPEIDTTGFAGVPDDSDDDDQPSKCDQCGQVLDDDYCEQYQIFSMTCYSQSNGVITRESGEEETICQSCREDVQYPWFWYDDQEIDDITKDEPFEDTSMNGPLSDAVQRQRFDRLNTFLRQPGTEP